MSTALEEWRKQRTPFLDGEAEEIGRKDSRSARRAFDAAAGPGVAAMTSRWYDTSDSEHELPGWRVPGSTSQAVERAMLKQRNAEMGRSETETDTDSDTSAKDTDDDSLLEDMAVAARRATRAKPGFRRWRRPERGDRSRIEAVQRRWDAAMETPLGGRGEGGVTGGGGADARHEEGIAGVCQPRGVHKRLLSERTSAKADQPKEPPPDHGRRGRRDQDACDDGDDDDGDVGGVTGAGSKEATGGGAVAGVKRNHQTAEPSTGDASERGFSSRLARRSVRFDDGAEQEKSAAAERARAIAATRRWFPTRRSSADQALSGGEPAGPAPVLSSKNSLGDTGTAFGRCTFALG